MPTLDQLMLLLRLIKIHLPLPPEWIEGLGHHHLAVSVLIVNILSLDLVTCSYCSLLLSDFFSLSIEITSY